MKSLTIRNIPDDVYDAIAGLAERNRRSIQQQLLILLERARLLRDQTPMNQAFEMRKKLAGRQLGDTVREIRRERER